MLAVMDHLKVKRAIIGGMSMGGPVMLGMYREAPHIKHLAAAAKETFAKPMEIDFLTMVLGDFVIA